MRFNTVFLCIALLMVSLAGCSAKTDEAPPAPLSASVAEPDSETPPESSAAEIESSQAKDVPSPPAELKIPGEITVYKIREESGIFEPQTVPMDKDEVTLLDIAAAVETQLDVKIPIKSIAQRKGMVVVDIAQGFIDSYGKAEIYQILTTLAATFAQNHMSFELVQYQLDGEVGVFGELWEIPPLKLMEGTPEEFAAIRAQVPYEGLQEYFWLENPIIDTDETGWRLTRFIAMLRLFDKDIASPAELDNQHVLETAIFATKYYTTDSMYSAHYAPELKPLEAPASEVVGFFEDCFWLKEHIEQSARLLYGDDFALKHEDFYKHRYIETIGVYTPPHMGGAASIIPIIFSYEDLGDCYRIELTYVVYGMGGYSDPDHPDGLWEQPIAEKDLKQYVQTKSKRREVVLTKTHGGNLAFASHKFL